MADVPLMNNPMTTANDIVVGGASGAPGRLAKGTDGQVLTVDPSTHNLVWATPASGFTNPMTTKGDIIVGDTGGSAIRKAVGTDGQVLTADAASTGGIKWAAAAGGGGGALVLLEQHTASSSATLDFTTFISSTYDEYVLEILGIIPATNATDLFLRMSTDGGSTYDSATNYTYTDWRYVPGGAAQSGADTGSIPLCNSSVDHISNNSSWGVVGTLHLFYPGDTTLYKRIVGQTSWLNSGGIFEAVEVRGAYKSATAVNAIRFFLSSGNIASGTIRAYGIAKT